jgi:hypothetical protein
MEHSMSHFEEIEPPRSFYCLDCDIPSSRRLDGWTAWKQKLTHDTCCGHGQQAEKPRADFYLYQHLWQSGLIDDLDLEELLVGKHRLELPARTRSRWDIDSKDRKEWQTHKEFCEHHTFVETRASSLYRPKLAALDEFRRKSWDATAEDYKTASGGVIAHVQQHIARSRQRCQAWRFKHQYCAKPKSGVKRDLSWLKHFQSNFSESGVTHDEYEEWFRSQKRLADAGVVPDEYDDQS